MRLAYVEIERKRRMPRCIGSLPTFASEPKARRVSAVNTGGTQVSLCLAITTAQQRGANGGRRAPHVAWARKRPTSLAAGGCFGYAESLHAEKRGVVVRNEGKAVMALNAPGEPCAGLVHPGGVEIWICPHSH